MTSDAPQEGAPAPGDLRASARGWQGVQLAVLGFVGLCGVLKDSGPAQAPRGIQVASAALALSVLGIACCAVLFVGFAAQAGPTVPSNPL